MISLLRLEEFDRLRRQSAMENQKRPAINFVDGEQQHLSKGTSGYHSYDGSNKSLGKDGCGYGTETIAPFGATAGDDTHRVTGWTSSDVFPEYKFRRVGEREDIEDEERRVRSRTDFLARRMDTDINMNSISARTLRPSGGKDRHSKVFTAKGPRDRRVRLSVSTAIQFYDVQDRLGYDQPSKAVEWLMKKAKTAIDELSQIPLPGIDRIISQGTSAYPNLSFRGPDTADVRLSDMQQHLDSEAPQFQDKLVTDISMSVGDRSRVYPTTTPHTPEHPREYNPILPSSYMYDMPSQHVQQNHQRMGLLQSPLQYHHHQQTSLVTVQQTYTQQHEFPHNLPFGVVPGNSHNPKQYLKIAGEKHAGNAPTASSSRFSGFLGGSLSVNPEVYTKPPPPAPPQHMEQFDGATSSDMMLSLEEQMHRKRS